MINPYTEYYINQAGTGLTAFEGIQYQRGHGFFGDFWSNYLKPLGKYLGKKALGTVANIGTEIIDGENVVQTLKSNLKKAGREVYDDGVERTKKFIQTGKGRRKRRIKKTQNN